MMFPFGESGAIGFRRRADSVYGLEKVGLFEPVMRSGSAPPASPKKANF